MAARLPIKEVESSPELDALIGTWYTHRNVAKQAAEEENEARKALVAYFYKEGTAEAVKAGREKFGMPSGWVLEIERKVNARIDQAALPAIREAIAALPIDPDSGEMPSIDAVIQMKPNFSESGYKNISREDVKELVDQCLTFTPGTPAVSLELKEVKAKAKAIVDPFPNPFGK